MADFIDITFNLKMAHIDRQKNANNVLPDIKNL